MVFRSLVCDDFHAESNHDKGKCVVLFPYMLVAVFLRYDLYLNGMIWLISFKHIPLAVMGQVLPEVRLRRQNLDQSHVLFPLAVGTALFPRAISDHLTLATLILSSLAGWHATGFSGYWYVGSDHNSRCNGVTLLTSSFALWSCASQPF